MVVFYTIFDGKFLYYLHPSSFRVQVLVCFVHICWLWVSFCVSLVAGVESSVSMDEVLQKLYRGKLEHREVDLVDRLAPS